jgi:hypothetical protein
MSGRNLREEGEEKGEGERRRGRGGERDTCIFLNVSREVQQDREGNNQKAEEKDNREGEVESREVRGNRLRARGGNKGRIRGNHVGRKMVGEWGKVVVVPCHEKSEGENVI